MTDPRASFEVGEAATLPAGSADVVVSGLVVNFLPDAPQAVAAMAAAARGGTVAAYVWDYAGGMQMLHLFWEAAASVAFRARLPVAEDGSVTLSARAYAVRGRA